MRFPITVSFTLALVFMLFGALKADIVWDGEEDEKDNLIGFLLSNGNKYPNMRFFVLVAIEGNDEDEKMSLDTLFFDPMVSSSACDRDYGNQIFAYSMQEPDKIYSSSLRLFGNWSDEVDFLANDVVDLIHIDKVEGDSLYISINEGVDLEDLNEKKEEDYLLPFSGGDPMKMLLFSVIGLIGLGLTLLMMNRNSTRHGAIAA